MQSEINAIDYPPTHTYKLDGLKPSGPLKHRVAVIEDIAPELFVGESFLDIGANKGYFTLRAAKKCKHVLAIEPMKDCVKLLFKIAPSNVWVWEGSFGSYPLDDKFDRIFAGNGPHYLYVEYEGWSWVERLAELATQLVVLEGPLGMGCTDMDDAIPEHLKAGFNQNDFFAAMNEHFSMEEIVPSPSYTPDRYITRWRRNV